MHLNLAVDLLFQQLRRAIAQSNQSISKRRVLDLVCTERIGSGLQGTLKFFVAQLGGGRDCANRRQPARLARHVGFRENRDADHGAISDAPTPTTALSATIALATPCRITVNPARVSSVYVKSIKTISVPSAYEQVVQSERS